MVSIAIATYNGEKFLKQQLDSIYNQTYKDFEVVVCDDCSSDKTVEILKEYNSKYGLKYFINDENLGFVKNFEKAISQCSGQFIAFCDQDDIWLPEKIEILLNEIQDSLLIHSDAYIVDENEKIISQSYSKYAQKIFTKNTIELLFYNFVTGCTTMINRRLLDFSFPFPKDVIAHDWWFAFIATKLNSVKYYNKPLIKYRQHSSNALGARVTLRQDALNFFKNGFFTPERNNNNKNFLLHNKSIFKFKKIDFTEKEIEVISDLIKYYESYFFKKFRFDACRIHIKYFKYFFSINFILVRIFRIFISFWGVGNSQMLNSNS